MADLATAFRNIKEYIKTEENKAIKELAFSVMSSVMQKTPVRTGRARAGWRHMEKSETEQHVYNTVEYIVDLEYGRSRQAPQGMARIALAEAKERIK